MFCFDWFLGYGLCGGYLMLQAIKVRWYGLAVTLSGVGNPTFGELLYMLSSRVLFMEAGGLYHDRHTAMLSTDHIRNIGNKAEYASIAKGNAKARYTSSALKCMVWRLRILVSCGIFCIFEIFPSNISFFLTEI